jgi:hypothetical protein
MQAVTVELFGIPRQRAGCATLTVDAATLGQAIDAVRLACPALAGLRGTDGRPAKHYLWSLDGDRFLRDPAEPLPSGARLLLLSADAGG